jgi:hypothetical protein
MSTGDSGRRHLAGLAESCAVSIDAAREAGINGACEATFANLKEPTRRSAAYLRKTGHDPERLTTRERG